MDSQFSTLNSSDQEIETAVPQKTVDPSSMSLVYSWMFSVLSFNSISLSDKEKNKIDLIEGLGNISLNNNHNNSNTNLKKLNNCKNENNSNNNNNNIENIKHQNNNNFIPFTHNLLLPTTKKTLILDLDETLVHSTLKPVTHHHLTVNVVIEDVDCTFYVIKRPHVDYFIEKVSEWYDIVIFTASMRQYADPLLDQLDQKKLMKKRLFRESCLEKDGNFIKDLSIIQQDLATTIIVDNSPIAYSNNIENALPIDNWMGDNPSDESLLTLLPFLEVLRYVNDVRSILSLRFTAH
eukprot:gene4878-6084_t